MAPDRCLDVAEEVSALLQQQGQASIVIGAMALAAHGYVRATKDLDLGTNATVSVLRATTETLRARGYDVELREPDGQAPLGGVLDVSGDFGLVQVVSFATTFPAVIRGAVSAAKEPLLPGSALLVTPLEQLVALKLYAGGDKSRADIAELLARTPDPDLAKLRAVCTGYGLGRQLEALLRGD